MLNKLEGLVRRTNGLANAIGSIAIGLMMLQVTAHSVSQYVFSYPLPGTIFFISNYYMVIVTFLCLAAVELRGGHISVDLFANLLPLKAQRFLAGLSYLVALTVFLLLTWQGFLIAESRRAAGSFELEYGIKFVIWPSYYFVPAGAGLMAITILFQFIRLVLGAPKRAEHRPVIT